MTTVVRKSWERPPNPAPAWLRALTGRKRAHGEVTVPRLEAELWPQPADPQHLKRYNQLCSIPDSPWLPPTYPQVMAGSLHLHLLTDPAFPLPAAGLVHVRNRIELLRPIGLDEALHFACHVEGQRKVAAGLEIDVVTVATVGGEPVWRGVITALSRQASPKDGKKGAPPQANLAPAPPHRSVILRVPADMGRRYAAIAGDYNPIHLTAATAKLFGFPRAIAHGMWSLARCLAECADDLPAPPLAVEVQFKRPVLLPSTVALTAWRSDGEVRFQLRSRDGTTLHLEGQAVRLA